MSAQQTQSGLYQPSSRLKDNLAFRWRHLLNIRLWARTAAVFLVVVLTGGSTLTAQQARIRTYSLAAAGWGFDLVGWEASALREKAQAAILRPAAGISPEDASAQVVEYMARADQIGVMEAEIVRLVSAGRAQEDAEVLALQVELDALREAQAISRLEVEQIIERQVSRALADAGFTLLGKPFPPVQFTFTEPPKKLIVSPRDRIATEHSRMLSPAMPLSSIESAETAINEGDRARSYITNIGGLGAFPTMVVDRASLQWVLSTVAHEWAHNYLALFPLGWNYFKSQDMTTLNESVAEIVGNEIGATVEALFYADAGEDMGEDLELTERPPMWELTMENQFRFDFRAEMRATRMRVDELLAEGRVEAAEAYMEERRQFFVEHGVPLRVLNQAYFAFHGSYGTSAASTSPIGPKLYELRDLSPDLETFLTTVRGFNDVDDLDAALLQVAPHFGAAGS